MRHFICLTTVFMLAAAMSLTNTTVARAEDHPDQPNHKDKRVPPVLDFRMDNLEGKPVELSKYQGKVILMVNVASKCGYTPQYKELEALHERFGHQGLVILGFPANDFHHQEPGTNQQIAAFCSSKYGVKFHMFSKIVVTGKHKAPLYEYLTSEKTDPRFAGPVKWNFEKFLIDRDGHIVNRFRSAVKPSSKDMVDALEAELAKKG